MEVTRKLEKINAVLKFEAKDVKEAFDQIAHQDEIFDPGQCGKCKGEDFKLSKRVVSKGSKSYTYREIVCKNCFHKLGLGQKQDDQSLFPQRMDKDGNPKPNGGWTKFNKDEEDE